MRSHLGDHALAPMVGMQPPPQLDVAAQKTLKWYAQHLVRSVVHIVSANSSRPISMRRISDVPAPISYNLASRHRRPSGYSLM